MTYRHLVGKVVWNDEGAQCPHCWTTPVEMVLADGPPLCGDCEQPMGEDEPDGEPEHRDDPDPAFHNSNAWDINQDRP